LPTPEDLRVRHLQVVTKSWFDTLVDVLNDIQFRGAIDYYGYVRSDILPILDLVYNLGRTDLRFLGIFGGYGYFAYDVLVAGKKISEIAVTGAYWYGGKVYYDVYPYDDCILNMGLPDKRWKEVHSCSGFFSDTLQVQGKDVLKDGDPINIADIYDTAKGKITQAVNDAYITDYNAGIDATLKDIKANIDAKLSTRASESTLQDVYGKIVSTYDYVREIKSEVADILANIDVPLSQVKGSIDDVYSRVGDVYDRFSIFTPTLLGYVVNQSASDFADIFASDLQANKDGRIRTKIIVSVNAYAYIKFIPSGLTDAIVAVLNAKNPIPSDAWHEFDFTVMSGDKVNVRVSPSCTVTVFVYNIGNT